MQQEVYWKELFTLRTNVEYVEQCMARSEWIDRAISVFLAVVASSSIGAWAVWKEYATLWAAVIASSQVITAVRSFLPYQERLKAFASLRNSLEELFIFADTRWTDVAAGTLSNEEIAKLREEIRKRAHEYLRKAFPSSTIPRNEQFLNRAQLRAEEYFDTFYGRRS